MGSISSLTTEIIAVQSWLALLKAIVDWTLPLKSQQRDFLTRLKSIQSNGFDGEPSSLIRCQIPGCHREEMVVSGDRVRELRALCRQLILESDPSRPVRELLRIYLKAQLAREAILSYCADALTPTDPMAQLKDATLADFTLKDQTDIGIRVKGIEDGEENGCWSWSADEIATCEAIACVLIREPVNETTEEYHLLLAGFLPDRCIPLQGDKAHVVMEDLLYSGGWRGYLEGLVAQRSSVEEPQTSNWLRPLTVTSNSPYPVAIAADGTTVASCSYDGRIGISKLEHPQLSQILAGQTWSVNPNHMDSGMATPGDNAFEVSQASSGQCYCTVVGHSSGVSAIALTPDAQTLVGGGFDGILKIWHLPSGDLQHSIQAHSGTVKPIAISANGEILATASPDKTLKCWRVENGKCVGEFFSGGEAAISLAIRSDGGAIAGGFPDGTLKIWNLKTGELQQTLTGHGESVWGLLFGEGDRLLASSSIEPTVKVWDLQGKRLERTLTGYLDPRVAISLNPDRQQLEVSLWRHRTPDG